MVWKIIKNFVFYSVLLLAVIVALYYLWAPRYYFPQTDVFFGRKIYNPYQQLKNTKWQKVGVYTYPAWYRDKMERLSGNARYYEVDEYYYDTILYAANQEFATDANIYSQGLFHDDQLVIGCDNIEWTDFPFVRDIHNKQHRINMIRRHDCLVYLKPSVIFDDYRPEHPKLLRNYSGMMVDESFKQTIFLWDQALSAGIYSTLIANTLPKSSRFLPEKNHRIMYVNKNAGNLVKALKNGNYFVAIKYDHQSDNKRPALESLLDNVDLRGDSLIIKTSQPTLAVNFFGQNGEVLQVSKNVKTAIYELKRKDSYVRAELLFEDGTHYYLNPVHRYAGTGHNDVPPAEVNFLKTWFLRGGGIFGLLIFVWFLIYLKRRVKIEIIEPES